ncbi:diguanylate cyclase, partial [Pseudomonas syringae]
AQRGSTGQGAGRSREGRDTVVLVKVLAETTLAIYDTAVAVGFTSSMQLSLFHIASRDSRTNLYTRRRVLHRLRELEGRRQGLSASLILLDIDHFKQLNDIHGHETGEVALQRVAETIGSSVRSRDMAARRGGEGILVLMAAATPGD